MKFVPEGNEIMQKDWVSFLVNHSGHPIELLDAFERQTDPAKIDGRYVLGLSKEIPK